MAAEAVPFVHQMNSKTCCHLDSSRATEATWFCSSEALLKAINKLHRQKASCSAILDSSV
jgi:hypothetical protein